MNPPILSFVRQIARAAAGLLLAMTVLTAVRAEESADGAPTYSLRYKFELGEVARYSVVHRATISTTIDDVSQTAQTQTDSAKVWKITDVLPDGQFELMLVVEHVHMKNQLPDRDEIEYDSRRDKTPPPGFEDAARAVGVPLSLIRMTPVGKVVDREIKYHQPAADTDAPVTILLPEEPVAVGATWNEPQDVTVQTVDGGTRVVHTRRHYELTDVNHGVADIDVAYQVLSPINAHIEAQLVQRLMKGTVRFDIEVGRILEQQMHVDQRVLGFAGPTSSMHYRMQLAEKLLKADPEVASRKPSAK